MEKGEIEILTIVKNMIENGGHRYVEMPSIDRRVLLNYSEVILGNNLKKYLVDLTSQGYLVWEDEYKAAVRITEKGIKYLADYAD